MSQSYFLIQATITMKSTSPILLLFLLISLLTIQINALHIYNNHTEFGYGQQEGDLDLGTGIPFSPQAINFRKSKLFPLFTIIRFSNEACRTSSEELGVCYTRSQCAKYGGTVSGNCAQNLGVCCQFTASCGGMITQNGTFFRNPDFPTKYRPSSSDFCQVRIRKQKNICQLRLGFAQFDIDGPSGVTGTQGTSVDGGSCKTDALTITSSGVVIPTVCGQLGGQHMYVNYGSSDTVTMSVMLSGNANKDREWSIQVLMLPCRSESLAPPGCLQYFQSVSGQITSFNYLGGTHLINMDYTACVRIQDGMRSIEWHPCETGSVDISGATLPATTNPTLHNGCGNPFDYLIIPGGVAYPLAIGTTGAVTDPSASTACLNYNRLGLSCFDRFCDYNFQVSGQFIRTSYQPFTLHFKTDGTEIVQQTANAASATTDSSTGFCLRFQQSPQ